MNRSTRRSARPRPGACRWPRARPRRLAATGLVLALGAGVNPSPAAHLAAGVAGPVAPSPVPRQDSTVQRFEVGGVTVIHRERPGDGLLAVDLYLLGGVRLATEETAGIEPLLLEASQRGTRNFPGLAALRAEVATGSRIVISAEPDWTMFGFRGISDEFESTWAVFADRVMHPELDSAGVSIARERMLTSRRAGSDDPEA
ncbi:MAG: hypothetical protein R3266_06660, partial [Gemmatimonadota bacterium]|nr:hypothetical protein [Gemmatimonadota bacterium]